MWEGHTDSSKVCMFTFLALCWAWYGFSACTSFPRRVRSVWHLSEHTRGHKGMCTSPRALCRANHTWEHPFQVTQNGVYTVWLLNKASHQPSLNLRNLVSPSALPELTLRAWLHNTARLVYPGCEHSSLCPPHSWICDIIMVKALHIPLHSPPICPHTLAWSLSYVHLTTSLIPGYPKRELGLWVSLASEKERRVLLYEGNDIQ